MSTSLAGTMTSRTQEAMFSLTPPASEFDEFDKTALLTCSPTSLSGFCYPSPAPSHRAQIASLSAESLYIGQDDMSFPEEHHTSEPQELFFGDSAVSSFYPASTIAETDMLQYTSANSAYPPYQQSHWVSFTPYPQSSSINAYEQSSSNIYPPLETSLPQAFPNIIPPTPQDIAPAAVDFNAPNHHLLDQQHLSTSPAFSRQDSHQSSHHTSCSSVSRSPSPSMFQAGASAMSHTMRSTLRSNSTSSNSSLHAYGIPVVDQSNPGQPSWRCAYPGCTSRATFARGCDLRKHYNRHSKHLFCRVDGCPQSQAAATKSADGTLTGGFSSKKDRARHEAKHNPGIKCEWRGQEGEECGRIFSRMDNMKDHVRRIHKKHEQATS